MTEQEMKQTWCPHVRVPDLITGGFAPNRDAKGGFDNRHSCYGRVCSQWRWEKVEGPVVDGKPTQAQSETDGYCGLAGPT